MLDARDARLITGDARLQIEKVRPGEVILAEEGETAPEGESGPPEAAAPDPPDSKAPRW